MFVLNRRKLDDITVKVIMDNNYSQRLDLYAEHGLSLIIRTNESEVIFDFGSGIKTLKNAEKMDLNLSRVKTGICSHGHYDHGNGFGYILSRAPIKKLFTGKDFFIPKYSFDGRDYKYSSINFDRNFLHKKGINHKVCTDVIRIDDQTYLVGNFRIYNSFEKIKPRYMRKVEGKYIKDDFSDEVCLVLKSKKGLIVVVGCAHIGIINILKTVSSRFPDPIYAVLGGTHLVVADEERMLLTINELIEIGVEELYLCHCSGDRAYKFLQKDGRIKNHNIGVGQLVAF